VRALKYSFFSGLGLGVLGSCVRYEGNISLKGCSEGEMTRLPLLAAALPFVVFVVAIPGSNDYQQVSLESVRQMSTVQNHLVAALLRNYSSRKI
jgi:hypothetical protein